jgi:hypothetical protein
MEIGPLDGERDLVLIALRLALGLEGGRRPQGGVECEVVGLAGCGAGLDVPAAFFLGAGLGTSAGGTAGKFIERGIQAPGGEGFPGLRLLAALPPGGIPAGGQSGLLLGAGELFRGTFLFRRAQLIFFFWEGSSVACGLGETEPGWDSKSVRICSICSSKL